MVTVFFWIVVVAVAFQRLSELVVARRNRNKALAAGGKEYGAGHYPLIVILHILWFGCWILEGWHKGPVPHSLWLLWLVLVLLAQVLRYWAMATLGPYWNTRIIVIPGAPRIKHGPYRFTTHPNYIAVTIELIAVPLIFGAWITAVIAAVFNAIVLLGIRIPAENRALEELK